MNKIVRDHYPVSRLPDDLRAGLDPGDVVRVVVENMDVPIVSSRASLRQLLDEARKLQPIGDDPVERIRKLRDEWDD
jgi:hypothetical protein